MMSRWIGWVAGAALWAGGCGDSTGLMIEVTRGESVPAEIGRISFRVGIDGVIPGDPFGYVDPEPEADIRLDGRDLASDPYRLLIRPSAHPQAEVMVAVVAYAGGDVVGFGALEQPVGFVDGEIVKWPIVLEGEIPGCFGDTETGCVTWVDEGGDRVTIGRPRDQDCDGWTDDDCDDRDAGINPGANESCGNAVDEDCDTQVDEDVDEDGDLVTTCGGDCDDRDGSVSPAAEEECDGADNDCDGMCDEGQDGDGDSYTACGSKIIDGGTACLLDPGKVDCDDGDGEVHPGAAEECDGVDNDCNSVCDDAGAGLDRDGDGFTACGSLVDHCGLSDLHADCDERNAAVHPGAPEVCDGVDNDCDGERLESGPCFELDESGDPTICFVGERTCREQDGEAGDWDAECTRSGQNDEAPVSACTAYDICDENAATHADPYACALEAQSPVTGCVVSYQLEAEALCDASEVVLPTGDLGDPPVCSWAVIGGVDQGDYSVGLREIEVPDGEPVPELPVCGAVLMVTSAVSGPPGPQNVLLARTDGLDDTVFFAVSLNPDLVDECDPPLGLECEEFLPLQ